MNSFRLTSLKFTYLPLDVFEHVWILNGWSDLGRKTQISTFSIKKCFIFKKIKALFKMFSLKVLVIKVDAEKQSFSLKE